MNSETFTAASELAATLSRKSLQLTAAESCTGGGLCYALTEIPGSSSWFPGGFVTYSNKLKTRILQVSEDTLSLYGAVSEPVVKEMLLGALQHSGADLGVAISGIAGPGGGGEDKPVGTVCFAIGTKTNILTFTRLFAGKRTEVRQGAIREALLQTLHFCQK